MVPSHSGRNGVLSLKDTPRSLGSRGRWGVRGLGGGTGMAGAGEELGDGDLGPLPWSTVGLRSPSHIPPPPNQGMV